MAIYRVALRAHMGNEDLVNVWHVTAPSGSEALIADQFEATVIASYEALASDAVTFDDITATDLATHTQSVEPLTGAGDVVDQPLPPQCAAVLTWRTNKVGRKYRGRTYVFGLSETDQDEGQWNGTVLGRLTTLANNLYSTWPVSFGGSLVVYHRSDQSTDVVTSYVIRGLTKTQRRRARGAGS